MITFPPDTPGVELQQRNLEYVLNEWNSPSRNIVINDLCTYDIKTIVDIGANVGVFTNICLERFSNVESILCFEPFYVNYNILKYNIKDPRVFLFNCGIFYGMSIGKVYYVQNDRNPGGGIFDGVSLDHLYPHTNCISEYDHQFEMISLEKCYESAGTIAAYPDLIKIDVEGSEYNIIENSLIVRNTKFLIIEFHGHKRDFLENYLASNLPNHKCIILTNEHYNTDHLYFTYLKREG